LKNFSLKEIILFIVSQEIFFFTFLFFFNPQLPNAYCLESSSHRKKYTSTPHNIPFLLFYFYIFTLPCQLFSCKKRVLLRHSKGLQQTKAKLTIRKSYGFQSDKLRETALYQTLANLPVPKITHKFV